jgi:ubiquitin C-terminal hydrolase
MIKIFSKFKQNSFKNLQEQKEINMFIPQKYTISFNNDLSANSNFNSLKNKPRRKNNSYDKIKFPYIKVILKLINENSKEFKLINKMNNIAPFKNKNIISLKNEENKDDEFQIIGFENIGHTCYINSFLQILFRTPSFLEKLQSSNTNKDNLINCLIDLSKFPKKIINIKKLKSIMSKIDENYGKYIQKDSQEFGINLINQLISNINGNNDIFDDIDDDDNITQENNISFDKLETYKNNFFKNYIEKYYKKENEIEKMFQFHESRLIIETNINNTIDFKRISFETNLNIEIAFPYNGHRNIFRLEELLDNKYPEYHNFYNEYKDIKDELNYDSIKEKILHLYKNFFEFCYKEPQYNLRIKDDENISIQNDIHSICFRKLASLPNILIISINRAFLGKSLNTSYLQYNETLDLKEYIDSDIVHDKNTTYKLYAVNECSGIIKAFGHCYSYIKIKNKWFKFNDKTVKEESPSFDSKYVVGLYYVRDNKNS